MTNLTTDLKGMAIMGTGKQRHHLSDHVEDLVFTCAQRNLDMYILVYMLNIDIRVSDDFSLFVQVPVMLIFQSKNRKMRLLRLTVHVKAVTV